MVELSSSTYQIQSYLTTSIWKESVVPGLLDTNEKFNKLLDFYSDHLNQLIIAYNLIRNDLTMFEENTPIESRDISISSTIDIK